MVSDTQGVLLGHVSSRCTSPACRSLLKSPARRVTPSCRQRLRTKAALLSPRTGPGFLDKIWSLSVLLRPDLLPLSGDCSRARGSGTQYDGAGISIVRICLCGTAAGSMLWSIRHSSRQLSSSSRSFAKAS